MLRKGSQVLSAIHIPQVWVISYVHTFTPHLGGLTCTHIPQIWLKLDVLCRNHPNLAETFVSRLIEKTGRNHPNLVETCFFELPNRKKQAEITQIWLKLAFLSRLIGKKQTEITQIWLKSSE